MGRPSRVEGRVQAILLLVSRKFNLRSSAVKEFQMHGRWHKMSFNLREVQLLLCLALVVKV